MQRSLMLAAAGFLIGAQAHAQGYPTPAVADYVFGCMASNGETPQALDKCSCSIDVISSIIPYKEYEAGETVLRMRQVRGGRWLCSGTPPWPRRRSNACAAPRSKPSCAASEN
jgi:hypothetical protein